MSEPIILSDEEDHLPPSIRFHSAKRRRTGPGPNPNPTVLILDDLTPQQPTASASKPYFESPSSDIEVVKCTTATSGDRTWPHDSDHKLSGIDGLICLESDDESISGCGGEKETANESITSGFGTVEDLDSCYRDETSQCSLGRVSGHSDLEHVMEEEPKETKRRKKMTEEERARLMEEKKLKKQQEKRQREALKAKEADMKKMEKEKERKFTCKVC